MTKRIEPVAPDYVNIPLLVTAPAGHEVMRITDDGTLVLADATEAAKVLLRTWQGIRGGVYTAEQIREILEGLRSDLVPETEVFADKFEPGEVVAAVPVSDIDRHFDAILAQLPQSGGPR